jgi:CrcB protein
MNALLFLVFVASAGGFQSIISILFRQREMFRLFIVGAGGFLGSAARYWISTAIYRASGEAFPYGTLVVNVCGCFLIGVLMQLFQERFVANPDFRIFLTIGILGGFTTFSTFSFETMKLLLEGSYFFGLWNILSTLLGCLGGTWLGITVAKIL